MKPNPLSMAVTSLENFRDKAQGKRLYWSPMMYTKPYSKDLIDKATNEELVAAGVNPIWARRLAKEG